MVKTVLSRYTQPLNSILQKEGDNKHAWLSSVPHSFLSSPGRPVPPVFVAAFRDSFDRGLPFLRVIDGGSDPVTGAAPNSMLETFPGVRHFHYTCKGACPAILMAYALASGAVNISPSGERGSLQAMIPGDFLEKFAKACQEDVEKAPAFFYQLNALVSGFCSWR